ncbi:MAG: hypothetical protein JST54_09270 [Deltaproteobacteria bacterium]|nr:hypothetical protein [Deltaproteobacteria bacterium]
MVKQSIPRVLGAGVLLFGAAFASSARADDPCTVNPTFTVTVGARQPPVLSSFLAGTVPADLTWTIGATPTPGASCSNMTTSFDIQYKTAAQTYFPNMGPNGELDGTAAETSLPAARYVFQGNFGCQCGLLGGPSQQVTVSDIVIPPTIDTAPLIINTNDFSTYQATDTLPVGAPLQMGVGVDSATVCPGEALTYHLSGAGVDQTVSVGGPDAGTDCNTGGTGATINFTPSSPGTLTLVASFQGAESNPVTWTVGAGGTSGGSSGSTGSTGSDSGGSTGSSSGGSSKSGCQAGGEGLFGLVALLGLARRVRRRR